MLLPTGKYFAVGDNIRIESECLPPGIKLGINHTATPAERICGGPFPTFLVIPQAAYYEKSLQALQARLPANKVSNVRILCLLWGLGSAAGPKTLRLWVLC